MPDRRWPLARSILWAVAAWAALACAACGLGPAAMHRTHLPLNEAAKAGSEEELLLDIVRLRYGEGAGGLSVTSILAQHEGTGEARLTPFFAAAGEPGRGFGAVLPGAALGASGRVTAILVPQDDAAFTRRLFKPLTPEAVAYLANTTWPISTVLLLSVESLNRTPNARTAGGPAGGRPGGEQFLRGALALRRLQDAGKVAILIEERDERVGGAIPSALLGPRDQAEAARAGYQFKPEAAGASVAALTRKRRAPFLHVAPDARASPEWLAFCRAFGVRPGLAKHEVTAGRLPAFRAEHPREGVDVIDLEPRSFLQMLHHASRGVEVPPEHAARGLAPAHAGWGGSAPGEGGEPAGLVRVREASGGCRPGRAAVAVRHHGHWFYIEEADHETRAAFSLLLHLSRLRLDAR